MREIVESINRLILIKTVYACYAIKGSSHVLFKRYSTGHKIAQATRRLISTLLDQFGRIQEPLRFMRSRLRRQLSTLHLLESLKKQIERN